MTLSQNRDDGISAIIALNEAIDALKLTAESVRTGYFDKDGDVAFLIELGHAFEHLLLAWHRRHLGGLEVKNETYAQYQIRSRAIPNWMGKFTLINPYPREGSFAVSRSSALLCIQEAICEIQAIEVAIESAPEEQWEAGFATATAWICLAWHLRHNGSGGKEQLMDSPERLFIPRWDYLVELCDPYEVV